MYFRVEKSRILLSFQLMTINYSSTLFKKFIRTRLRIFVEIPNAVNPEFVPFAGTGAETGTVTGASTGTGEQG